MNKERFKRILKQCINQCCMKNGSDTPDYVLTEYLIACLEAFDNAVKKRDVHMGKERINTLFGIGSLVVSFFKKRTHRIIRKKPEPADQLQGKEPLKPTPD
jgi:hypothetical protein